MATESAFQAALERRIGDRTGFAVSSWQQLGDGVGGTAWQLRTAEVNLFVKTASGSSEILVAEAEGLIALSQCGAVRTPQVLDAGEIDGTGFLVMEWLEFNRVNVSPGPAASLGAGLARQHRHTAAQFGWPTHNFIGATPQFNYLTDDWTAFFREHRLGFQLRLAAENGYRGDLQTQGARLLDRLPEFFTDYSPKPSLLHGDLWGGNWGILGDGEPVIFDPAVYFGDRETDIAMTELFGGFAPEFYAAYQQAYPLDSGYRKRRKLYNLYHLLNHLNLFGDSYLSQVQQTLRVLLSEPG